MVIRVPLYTRPAQARSQVRFQKIIDAARDHVSELGFNDLNITTLANKAGISVHSVYRYFPDMTAICARFLEEFHADIDTAIEIFLFEKMSAENWEEEVGRFIKYLAIHIIERPWIVKTKLICRLDPQLEEHWWRMSLDLENRIQEWLIMMNYKSDNITIEEMGRFIILQIDALIFDIGRSTNDDKMQSMDSIRKIILSYLAEHIPSRKQQHEYLTKI